MDIIKQRGSKLKISSIFKTAIPFILGLLIGAGATKNKSVIYIIIGYVAIMFLFGLLKDKIMNVKKADNKKHAIKHEAMETVKDIGEVTLKGNNKGAHIFEKYYGDYIFYINVALFLALIILAVYGMWLWVLVAFLGLQFHMVLNQNVRMTREVKEQVKVLEKKVEKDVG